METSYSLYIRDLHRAKSFGRLPAIPQNIKQEIFTNGPVIGALTIYEDIRVYKAGVYVHQTGSFQGIHTLKIIGWGVESGQDYWLAVNSWNEEWGDHGMIKLAVGRTGIENSVYYVEPA
ncbi:cathepsin b, putative [Perkinsus marinus ATCC 50983]|uniref:Cathepsin b, putative n=1 Tax=Perkinsus marinus (strain ATCC 50983 / TXsc) TaxID=423536 RepID=C5LWU3_PERM5|nr:cathepsin b, putative [Perkinsus marinus ATCC 50983]EEQ98799.1 cathepsin b, putative [Perkinsus marinus ATCC 50983]|eukprot:XP_002766082.1 cathepsin b, putative [Perkinsus marinus ATCC 50983]